LYAIQELETDNRELIAEDTGIAKSTVQYRIDRLRERGIIKNNLCDFQASSLGFEIKTVSKIKVKYTEGHSENIGEKIADVKGVEQVYWVMGAIDFIVISHLPSHQELQRLFDSFHSIDEILESDSNYVVETIKDESDPISNYSLDDLREINELD